MESLVRHLHAFIGEVRLTETEWQYAVDFLTRTGQLCDDQRQEFVLLSGFNPARRDNMIAIMAARSDAPNYGGLIVYTFPKQKLVYGPRQVDARHLLEAVHHGIL